MYYFIGALLITFGSGYFLFRKRIHDLGYQIIRILEEYHGHLIESEIQERLRKKGEYAALCMVKKTCRDLEKAGCVIRHGNSAPLLFRVGNRAWIKWNHREPFRTNRLPI